MYKKIEFSGKSVDFKCSAATSILYKRLFGQSLSTEIANMATLSSSAYKMLGKLEELQKNKDENNEEILDLLASNTSIVDLTEKTEKIGPQMAYIMWLEANKPQRELFQCLTEEEYIKWLSGFDKEDMANVYSELMQLWTDSNKTNSNLKNA